MVVRRVKTICRIETRLERRGDCDEKYHIKLKKMFYTPVMMATSGIVITDKTVVMATPLDASV